MHRIVIIISFAAVACTNPTSQQKAVGIATQQDSVPVSSNPPNSATLSTDSAISFIRNAFQQINTATLRKQAFKWTADNCNGDGTATYYLNQHNEIVKVVETGAIGDGSWTTAYYYQNGQFIFSLQTDIGGPAVGPVDTFTVRKYVYGNKVIRILRNDTYDTPMDSLLTATSKEYRIQDAYKTKNFGAAFCE